MNLTPDLSPGWHWALLITNLPSLMFYAMMVIFVVIGFAARDVMFKLLGIGLALGTLGLVAVATGWSQPVFWTVILTIGFVLTVLTAIGSAINAHKRR